MWRWLRGIVIFGGPNERRIVKRRIEIGILYSRSGNYRLISEYLLPQSRLRRRETSLNAYV